ncbi:MAG: DUF1365 domain-containing protein [Pedobacter sp.]|nr:DUF1365 domain-containing protein [Pedobacter sp.]
MPRPWLYRGAVSHQRLLPKEHVFSYPAFFICFPLQEKLQLRSRFFGLNRFNLFSFHDADHGDGQDAEVWIRQLLATEKIDSVNGDIHLLCLPRMLGFVFNPVSFWFCHDRAGALQAILCEVKNTFGERHCYLLQTKDGQPIRPDTELQSRKVFHVSPFFPVTGEYRFRFEYQEGRCSARINYEENGQLMLRTALAGKAQTLSDGHLVRLFFSLGWSTLLVVIRIHWQALRLWLKGIPFHRKPSPPVQEISR